METDVVPKSAIDRWREREAARRAQFAEQGDAVQDPRGSLVLSTLSLASALPEKYTSAPTPAETPTTRPQDSSTGLSSIIAQSEEAREILDNWSRKMRTVHAKEKQEQVKREAIIRERAIKVAEDRARQEIEKNLETARTRIQRDLKEYSTMAKAAGQLRRSTTETVTRSFAQQKRRAQAQDAVVRALYDEQDKLREIIAEQRRIFEERREERRLKALQDSNTLKKVQASLDQRKQELLQRYQEQLAAIEERAHTHEENLRQEREQAREKVAAESNRRLEFYQTSMVEQMKQTARENILKRHLVLLRRKQKAEAEALAARTREAKEILDKLFAEKQETTPDLAIARTSQPKSDTTVTPAAERASATASPAPSPAPSVASSKPGEVTPAPSPAPTSEVSADRSMTSSPAKHSPLLRASTPTDVAARASPSADRLRSLTQVGDDATSAQEIRRRKLEELRQLRQAGGRQSRAGTVVEPPKPSPPPPAPVAQAASAKDAASKTWSAEQVAKFKRMLTNGAVFLKHGRQGRPHKRFIWVPAPYENVHWGVTMKKPSEKECLPIKNLDLVLRGQATAVFARHSGQPNREEMSFSLVVDQRTLDLEADSVETRNEWAEAFEWLSANKDALKS